MDATEQAREIIEKQLAKLNDERQRIESALSHLVGSSREPQKPRAKRRRKRAGKAAPGQRQREVLADVQANPGTKASEVAKRVGIPAPQVHGVVKGLVASKAIRKAGATLTAI